jgi:hypothetical protein
MLYTKGVQNARKLSSYCHKVVAINLSMKINYL